ncbi:OmpW/AlkL family protein [Undibacterium parvum]|uniref:OmpW family protein n=2 Tax=Undibacterium TaxID=401469 RepID=A0A6M4A283_9BURK|nr:OmpW family outer membrane protein [Undibacterium parvum]AZP14313.1 OmpW family protein [Undibacterium parvum]QJQ05203.1 OmpW family protein [Undibacterium piscinae]
MQQKFAVVSKIAALSLFACFAAPVMAQSAGSVVVNVGWAHIAPNDSSTPLAFTYPVQKSDPLSGAGVDATNTLGVALNYFYTDNVVFAADLGVPPTYKLHGEGSLASVGEIGDAKQWAPTALVKYFFGNSKSKLRPYLGGGVTYVRYSDVELTSAFQQRVGGTIVALSQGKLPASLIPSIATSADLGSGFAPVITGGVSYEVSDNWYANFSLSYVKLKTEANLTTTYKGTVLAKSNTTLTLDPLVAFASVGYRF